MKLVGNYAVDNTPPPEHEISMDNYLENMHKLSGIFRSIIKKRGYSTKQV
jgi:hypothetical protein